MRERIEVYKPTHDEWYPSFCATRYGGEIMKLVEVSFIELEQTHPDDLLLWRVCAWGDDDMGLEKDFDNRYDAWRCFVKVISMEFVDQQALKDLGFQSA